MTEYSELASPVRERARVPDGILGALARYVEHRIRPGDCTYAILANDLFGAFARADPVTAAAMRDIVAYVNHHMHPGCWGSHEKVERWIAGSDDGTT